VLSSVTRGPLTAAVVLWTDARDRLLGHWRRSSGSETTERCRLAHSPLPSDHPSVLSRAWFFMFLQLFNANRQLSLQMCPSCCLVGVFLPFQTLLGGGEPWKDLGCGCLKPTRKYYVPSPTSGVGCLSRLHLVVQIQICEQLHDLRTSFPPAFRDIVDQSNDGTCFQFQSLYNLRQLLHGS
jgi:hypothetical protein